MGIPSGKQEATFFSAPAMNPLQMQALFCAYFIYWVLQTIAQNIEDNLWYKLNAIWPSFSNYQL